MYCIRCGNQLNEGDIHCIKCGAPADEGYTAARLKEPERSELGSVSVSRASGIDYIKSAPKALASIQQKSPLSTALVVLIVAMVLCAAISFAMCRTDLSGTYRCTDSDYWIKSVTFSENGSCYKVNFDGSTASSTYSNFFGTYSIDGGWASFKAEKQWDGSLKLTMHTATDNYLWDGKTAIFRK